MKRIQAQLSETDDVALSRLGFNAVTALSNAPKVRGRGIRGHRPGTMPIDDGDMADGYVFQQRQRSIRLGNTARSKQGYSYPQLWERKARVAQHILRGQRREIIRATEQAIRKGRPYRGSRRVNRLSRR